MPTRFIVAPTSDDVASTLTINASVFEVRTINAVPFVVLVAVLETLTVSGLPDCVLYDKLLDANVILLERAIYFSTLVLSKKGYNVVLGLKSEPVNNIFLFLI